MLRCCFRPSPAPQHRRNIYICVCLLSDKYAKDGELMSDAGVLEGNNSVETWDEDELIAWMDEIEELLKQIKEI